MTLLFSIVFFRLVLKDNHFWGFAVFNNRSCNFSVSYCFAKLKTIFSEFFMALSAEVLPTLNSLAEAMIKSYKEGGALRDVLTSTVAAIELLMPVVKVAILIVDSLANIFVILAKAIGGRKGRLGFRRS